jgi:hypothetical protein
MNRKRPRTDESVAALDNDIPGQPTRPDAFTLRQAKELVSLLHQRGYLGPTQLPLCVSESLEGAKEPAGRELSDQKVTTVSVEIGNGRDAEQRRKEVLVAMRKKMAILNRYMEDCRALVATDPEGPRITGAAPVVATPSASLPFSKVNRIQHISLQRLLTYLYGPEAAGRILDRWRSRSLGTSSTQPQPSNASKQRDKPQPKETSSSVGQGAVAGQFGGEGMLIPISEWRVVLQRLEGKVRRCMEELDRQQHRAKGGVADDPNAHRESGGPAPAAVASS